MTNDLQIGQGEEPRPKHCCHLGEWNKGIQLAADLLAAGLRKGERCFLSGHWSGRKGVIKRLVSLGFDVSLETNKRMLVQLPAQSTGMATLGCIAASLHERPKQGSRIVGFPSWDRTGWPNFHDMLAYESWIEDLMARYQVSLCLCIYDEDAAPALVTNPHALIIVDNNFRNNPTYVPGHQFRRHLRRESEIA